MSSSPSTTTTTTTINGRLTYWCYQCDMSVSLFSSSPPLHCPHCHGKFLLQMDCSSSTSNNPNSNSNYLPPPPPPLHPFPTTEDEDDDDDDDDLDSSSFQIPSSIRVSDAYLLDRLIQHLSDPQDNNDDHHNTHHHGSSSSSSPASKASVESIPTLKITTSYLASETILLCAVCKDEFLVDDEAKQLPCNHIYHFDCILPWLKHHNSCPVCRFKLPVEPDKKKRLSSSSHNGTRVAVRFGNLMDTHDDDDDDDEQDEALFGMGSTLRRIARRHRLFFPTSGRSNAGLVDSSSSPTQMAQAETTSSAGPANSGETVSSWPIEGGSRMGGGGASGRVDEDGDTVMSEVRGGY